MVFQNIQRLLEEGIEALDRERTPVELYQPIRYLMLQSRQLFNAHLGLLSQSIFTDDLRPAVKPAIGAELFYSFITMSDDLINGATERHGAPTVHEKWGQNTVILSGDAMLINSYQFVSDVAEAFVDALVEAFIHCTTRVIEGRQVDLQRSKLDPPSSEAYLAFIRRHIAVLPAFCAELGAILAGTEPAVRNQLRAFGEELGMAVHLQHELDHSLEMAPVNGGAHHARSITNRDSYLKARLRELSGQPLPTDLPALLDKYQLQESLEREIKGFFQRANQLLDQLPLDDERKEPMRRYLETLVND